jgi:hypothetical protein
LECRFLQKIQRKSEKRREQGVVRSPSMKQTLYLLRIMMKRTLKMTTAMRRTLPASPRHQLLWELEVGADNLEWVEEGEGCGLPLDQDLMVWAEEDGA